MKFIAPSQLLLKNLRAVSSIIPSQNNAVPATANVKFEIEGSTLKITGTDLETTITTEVNLSDCEGSGSFLAPPKLIVDTLKNLPEIMVEFNIDDNYTITINADETTYNTVGFGTEEFPQMPHMNELGSLEIDSKILLNAISKTAFATDTNGIRAVMAGILCEIQPEHISFVATDAHRLVRYRNLSVKSNLSHSMILPKKPIMVLRNILDSLIGNVKVEYDETRACFTIDSITITSRLVDGKYPSYENVIPKNNHNILQIERLPFLQRMRSIAPYANQSTHQIRLKLDADKLSMKAEDLDLYNKATSTLACTFENMDGGDNYEIGFSAKFLQEILSNLDSNEVILQLASPQAAGLIFPKTEDNSNEEILMLLMPVMLT